MRTRRDQLVELVLRCSLPDQPPVGGLTARDFVGEKCRAHSFGKAHIARHEIAPASIRDQSDQRERLHEIGVFARDHHVSRQCKIGPCPRRRTVHRRDGWNGAVINRAQHRFVFFNQCAFQINGGDVAGPAKILPGAKAPTRPRHYQHPRQVSGVFHCVQNLGPHLRVHPVQNVRTVQGQRRNLVFDGQFDG